jgi:hypothetical protein
MNVKCCVKWCKNDSNCDSRITLHKLPLHQPETLKVWLEKIDLEELKFSSRICSQHFDYHSFIMHNNELQLHPLAVPLSHTSSNENEFIQKWNREEFKPDNFKLEPVIDEKSDDPIDLIKEAISLLERISGAPRIEKLVNPIKAQLSSVLKIAESEIDDPIVDVIIKEEPSNDESTQQNNCEWYQTSWERPQIKEYEPQKVVSRGRPSKPKQQHQELETGQFSCQFCDQIFASKRGVNNHFHNVHAGPFFCDYCGKETKAKKSLKDHILRQHCKKTDNRIKCPQCDVRLLPECLGRHIRARHLGLKTHIWYVKKFHNLS